MADFKFDIGAIVIYKVGVEEALLSMRIIPKQKGELLRLPLLHMVTTRWRALQSKVGLQETRPSCNAIIEDATNVNSWVGQTLPRSRFTCVLPPVIGRGIFERTVG
jgi:hypothetical protein